ncbi:hypothetical protein [Rubripirellula reticaptiva]|uniref:hypothetical protein n=1 Tax=Rubripirellula reticaptiva TaxID=2528013 RepID=UPI0016476DA4|nr:hypothetical protein [Rubripirellula reticaptiva]
MRLPFVRNKLIRQRLAITLTIENSKQPIAKNVDVVMARPLQVRLSSTLIFTANTAVQDLTPFPI